MSNYGWVPDQIGDCIKLISRSCGSLCIYISIMIIIPYHPLSSFIKSNWIDDRGPIKSNGITHQGSHSRSGSGPRGIWHARKCWHAYQVCSNTEKYVSINITIYIIWQCVLCYSMMMTIIVIIIFHRKSTIQS